jgi:hypothetical protein
MADTTSRGEQQGRRKRSVVDAGADKRVKKALLASLADEYEAKAESNNGKPYHGTMKGLLNLPTAKALSIKRHAIQYELDKRKKIKQDMAMAMDVPLPTTTNDENAEPQMPPIDPQTPIDSQTASTKKVGCPSLVDKAAQAKVEAKMQNAITDAASAFAQMQTDARAVGKKAPYGGLLSCIEEAKAANGIPTSHTISRNTIKVRVLRGNHTGQKFQSPL